MLELQEEKSSRWIDVQFLEVATEQLIECRRTLKYTYVYAFYLPDGSEKTLFEYLQAQLETETENLSGILERSADINDKKKVVEITLLAGKRLNNLIEGVKSGLVPDASKPKKQETSSSSPTVVEKVLGKGGKTKDSKQKSEKSGNRFWVN